MNGIYFDESMYESYLKKLIEIFKSSTEDNSIIVEFYLNEKECKTAVKEIKPSGDQEMLAIKNFGFNLEAKEKFFLKAITAYALYNDIFTTTIVSDSNDSTKNTVRIITKKNDIFNINGLNVELANQLIDEINVILEEKKVGIVRDLFTTV